MSRIDRNRALYESWPLDAQEAILAGRVEKGMTHEMVEMILGEPTEIKMYPGRTGEEEVWTYIKTSSPVDLGGTGISVGAGSGGISIGGGGGLGGSGVPRVEDSRDIVFQNGKVIRGDEVVDPRPTR